MPAGLFVSDGQQIYRCVTGEALALDAKCGIICMYVQKNNRYKGGRSVDARALLRQYGKKTIAKAELEQLFGLTEESRLYALVQRLLAEGLLAEMPRSRTNGNRVYPLYLKYKITLPEESFAAEQAEIARLHPLLQSTGYLQKKPALYREHRDRLQKLDAYLFSCRGPAEAISRKERSFAIFYEEKALEKQSFCALLDKLGLTAEVLGYYDTPKYCFPDYIPLRKPQMVLLICENKDIWFNLRRRMFEDGASVFLDTPLDGVVFGGGNGVTEKGALTAYTAFLGDVQVRYLYWGDIDREGFQIYLRLKAQNPGLSIELFAPAYVRMLRLSAGIPIQDSEDHRILPEDYTAITAALPAELRPMLIQLMQDNKHIPQEIIPYTDLKENMR